MPSVVFAAPLLSENASRMIAAVVSLPDVRVGVITHDPFERMDPALRERVAAHWRVDDILNPDQLAHAVECLAPRLGSVDRLFGAYEQLQVPLAEVRERLGLPGMPAEVARNFRDKARMKTILARHGLPCARHCLAYGDATAVAFADQVGFPLVLKPPAGAGALRTFQVDDVRGLGEALRVCAPASGNPVQIEEFVAGDEHSFETVSIGGRAVWHSLTHYHPAPLDVLRNPWIQWCVVLPREIDEPYYDDIRRAAFRALEVLGMDTGLSHMEWFRRRDGSVAISEVAARPPGAQITSIISWAHDIDFLEAWARLMVYGTFAPPTRRYAVGAAYLRGQGRGAVQAIHGLEAAQRELGSLVVEAKLPTRGQTPTGSYEGEGYVILRHPETAVVEQAVRRLITLVRVELG